MKIYHLKKNKVLFFLPLAFILLFQTFLLSGCKLLVSQNPEDSFANRQLPRQLQLIANQTREFTKEIVERIIKRTETDKQNPNLLKVATIDSGLDLVQPDLIDQLDYNVKDGKILGVGYDIMGKDNFPSYVMVDPTLFAFGAEKVENGIIHGQIEAPLAFMQKINQRFIQLILEGIANHPQLRTSYFARLNDKNFTVFGLDYLMHEWNADGDPFKDYNEAETEKQLIKINPRPEDKVKLEFYTRFNNSWAFNSEYNAPAAMNGTSQKIEHFKEFYNLVDASLKQIDQEFQYHKQIEQITSYMSVHSEQGRKKKEVTINPYSTVNDIKKLIMSTGSFMTIGYKAFDFVEKMRQQITELSDNPGLNSKEAFLKAQSDLEKALLYFSQNPDLTPQQRESAQVLQKQMPIVRQTFDMALKTMEESPEGDKLRSQIRRDLVRSYHPYISSETLSNEHHTHVSATIAKQNPDIRIYPVKVTTQTVAAPEQLARFMAQFADEMKEWSKDPLIKELLKEIMAEYKTEDIKGFDLEKEMKKYVEANMLNLLFVKEIFQAIQHVGEQKIKLANVSLGTTFQKSHDGEQAARSAAGDIFAEFVRYKMGEAIEKYAPGTLFLVATGNDGGWFDGVSKSAFPVGLTSIRLDRIAKRTGLPDAPNNTVKNVLGVASVNATDATLSSFTNLLLDIRTEQIFSTGEEVIASVPSRQQETHDKMTEKLFTPLTTALDEVYSAIDDIEKPADEKANKEFWKNLLAISSMRVTKYKLKESFAQLLRIAYPITRHKMSGTSMATPTATGVLADFVIKKAKSLGVSAKEIYNHPQFAPAVLIQDAIKMATTKQYGGMLTLRMLIDGIKTWEPTENQSKAQSIVDGLKNSAAYISCAKAHRW